MRFDYIVLAVVAASVAHAKSPLGVSGLPITYADDPGLVNDNSDAVSAQRNLKALDTHNSEERLVFGTEQLPKDAQAFVDSVLEPQALGFFRLIQRNAFAKLFNPFVNLDRFYQNKFLELYEKQHGVIKLVIKLVLWIECDVPAIREYAKKLMNCQLEFWVKKAIPAGDLLKVLEVSDNFLKSGEDNNRKIRAIGLYIDHANKKKKIQPTLIETLAEKYGRFNLAVMLEKVIINRPRRDYAEKLLQQLMESWKVKKWVGSVLFARLEFDKIGLNVFETFNLVILKHFVEYMGEDMLHVLSDGFNGTLNLAEFTAKAFTSGKSPTAGKYLGELLQRWKIEGKKLDDLKAELGASRLADGKSGASLLVSAYSDLLTKVTVV